MAAAKKIEETTAKKPEKKVDRWEEKVPVRIPQPEGDTIGSVTVTHNGRNYQIQYNKEVMVPRKIAKIIEESQKNQAIADAERSRLEGYHELGSVM